MDPEATIRFKGSRVTLDSLVGCLQRGESVEEIQDNFPTLSIPRISGAIAWYLENQVEADEYLKQREIEADAIRDEIVNRPEYIAFKQRILKRRQELKL